MAVVVVSKIQKKGWLTVDCSGGWWRDDGFGGSGFCKMVAASGCMMKDKKVI